MGQVSRLSNDIDSTVVNRFKQDPQVGLSQAMDRLRSTLVCNGRNVLRVDLVLDLPLLTTDDGGDVTYSVQPLERGERVWSAGMCFRHGAVTGPVQEGLT